MSDNEDKDKGVADLETAPAVSNSSAEEEKPSRDEKASAKKQEGNAKSTLAFFILFVAVCVVALVFFVRFRRVTKTASRDRFEAEVVQMQLYVDSNTDAIVRSMTDLSVRTTSMVKQLAEETEYPPGFATIPDAHQVLGAARESLDALAVAYLPRVESDDLDLWEGDYAPTHASWIAAEDPNSIDVVPEIEERIWEFSDYDFETSDRKRRLNKILERPGDCAGEEERRRRHLDTDMVNAEAGDTFYTPVWQLSPVPILNPNDPYVQIINYNMRDRIVFYKAIEYIEKTRQPVILDVCDQASWFLISGHRGILQTAIVAPVFEDFSDTASIVGYHVAVVPWANFFQNQRGPDSLDMVVDVSNTCGEHFSVELKGNRATVIPDEADKQRLREFGAPTNFTFAQSHYKRFVETVPSEEICMYTMSFYASEEV